MPVRVLIAAASSPPASPAEGVTEIALTEYELDPATYQPRHGSARPDEPASVLVLSIGGGEVLFVAGTEVGHFHVSAGSDLLELVMQEASSWRARWVRAAGARRADERLIVLAERLNRESTREGVFDALAEHGTRVVDGHAMLLLLPPRNEEGEPRVLEMIGRGDRDPRVKDLPLEPFAGLGVPGLIRADQLSDGDVHAELVALFEPSGAVLLAYVPLGGRGVIALLERRRERVFEPEEWYRLGAIARHVSAALDRIELMERNAVLERLLEEALHEGNVSA